MGQWAVRRIGTKAAVGAASAWGMPVRASSDFQTTRWRVVLGAAEGAREHLEDLCRSYWYPVYAFIRGQGIQPDDALDITQSLFTSLLARNDFAKVDPERGRFRSWLRSAAKNHLRNWRKQQYGKPCISIDAMVAEERYRAEPYRADLAPDILFDRYWAATLTARARALLRQRYENKGKADVFAQLESTLVRDEKDISDAALSLVLGADANNVRKKRERLKDEFRQCLRELIAGTVADPESTDDELRQLIHVYP